MPIKTKQPRPPVPGRASPVCAVRSTAGSFCFSFFFQKSIIHTSILIVITFYILLKQICFSNSENNGILGLNIFFAVVSDRLVWSLLLQVANGFIDLSGPSRPDAQLTRPENASAYWTCLAADALTVLYSCPLDQTRIFPHRVCLSRPTFVCPTSAVSCSTFHFFLIK